MAIRSISSGAAFRPGQPRNQTQRGAALLRAIEVARRTARTRRELGEVTWRQLRDVGLNPFEAQDELLRKPWDLGNGPKRHGFGFATRLRSAWQRLTQRRLISTLDDAALRDMGISRAEAEAEANKPFWRE
jgi:uncharacterized protein YjiS (DUF1127 family)